MAERQDFAAFAPYLAGMNRRALLLTLPAVFVGSRAFAAGQSWSGTGPLAVEVMNDGRAAQGGIRPVKVDLSFDTPNGAPNRLMFAADLSQAQVEPAGVSDFLRRGGWTADARQPAARFVSREIKPVGDRRWRAEGTLAVLAISLPFAVDLALTGRDRNKPVLDATGLIRRGDTPIWPMLAGSESDAVRLSLRSPLARSA